MTVQHVLEMRPRCPDGALTIDCGIDRQTPREYVEPFRTLFVEDQRVLAVRSADTSRYPRMCDITTTGGTRNRTSVPKYAATVFVVGGLGSLRVVGMRTGRTDRGPPGVVAWGAVRGRGEPGRLAAVAVPGPHGSGASLR